MKIQGSKKDALKILVPFVLVLIIVLAIVLYSNSRIKYPQEPLKMTNLGKTEQSVDISSLEMVNEITNVPVYFVEPKLHITLVEEMIDRIGLSLDRKDIVENSYVEWGDGKNIFTYDSVSDSVTFQIQNGISIERGSNSFSKIFEQYLDLQYEFVTIQEKRNPDGGITYYSSRVLDGLPIQYGSGYEYSDILRFDKQGNLVSGQILLAQIDKYDVYLPLISKNDLNKYINTKEYPKEYYVDTELLADALSLHYLDSQWGEIESTLSDCMAQSSELILLYKTSNQGYLLPVFKIFSNCNVTSNEQDYSVPGIFYVNASDPNYITL